MNEQEQDIFGEVAETEVPKGTADPTKQLYHLPADFAAWFIAKDAFEKPKDIKNCTATLVVRFLSWQISQEQLEVYKGTGVAAPGVLRNQLVVRYHTVPDGYEGEERGGRVPCRLQFGESCRWCAEKQKAENRIPREKQPQGYFKDVIARFKPKDKSFMLAEIWEPDGKGGWKTDHKVHAFEFTNYVKTGRTFNDILNARANDADKRLRIDKKSYAGYVTPVALKLTFSYPTKDGKPDMGKFASWVVTDATPFPVDAGGPDVSQFTKEWARDIAKHDPAAWINREAWPKVNPVAVGQWLYDLFTGAVSAAPKIDFDTADFGQLIAAANANKNKFDAAGVNLAEFDYEMVEPLRAVVKGVLNG